ncbi:tetraspanin-33 [Erythrolamprus reginae]|uniref:tetraspanin-33 n=1 Tax=Erythrolamprus reginae TaxID=121349 RepID=UPI00396CEC1B
MSLPRERGVNPLVKYLLFFFNFLFWVISVTLVAVGIYARVFKHAEAAVACFAMDPALLLVAIGVLVFFITFCGCVGSLRENICLLQTFSFCLALLLLLQLAVGILGFVFSEKAREKMNDMVSNAIVHYRDDLDLQNLIDFGQTEFSCCGGVSYKDWSQNMYFNCSPQNPSREFCSVPYSCCRQPEDQSVINTMCGQMAQMLSYTTADEFIHTSGCIDSLVDWMHSNLLLIGAVALGLTLPQLIGLLLSQMLVRQLKDQIRFLSYNQRHQTDYW